MAQKITVVLEDDLDGGPADETVRFALDGAAYEIELSKKHAKAFRRKPARPGGGRAAAAGGVRRAGSAATVSGRGRRPTASRSATAGAFPPASPSSTRPPPEASDLGW